MPIEKRLNQELLLLTISFVVISLVFHQVAWIPAALAWAALNFFALFLAKKTARATLVAHFATIFNLIPIFFLKSQSSQLLGLIPIGVSFFFFRSVWILQEFAKGRISFPPRFSSYLLYLLYFPTFFLGPIENFQLFEKKLLSPLPRLQFLSHASLFQLLLGLLKMLILGPTLEQALQSVWKLSAIPDASSTLMAMYANAVCIYCSFSGWIDIASFLSRFLGIELEKNFDHPILARNPQDFWLRWHISLSNWLRSIVFYPLLEKTKNLHLSIFLTIFFTGIWHGFEWKFFWAGILHATGTLSFFALKPLLHGIGNKGAIFRFSGWLLNLHLMCAGLFLLGIPNATFVWNSFPAFFVWGSAELAWPLFLPLAFVLMPLAVLERLQIKYGNQIKLTHVGIALVLLLYFGAVYRIFPQNIQKSTFLYFQF